MCEPISQSSGTNAPFVTAVPGRAASFGFAASVGRCTGKVLGCESMAMKYGLGRASSTTSVLSSGAETPSADAGCRPATMSVAFRTGSSISAYWDAVAGFTNRRNAAAKSSATTGSPFDQRAARAQSKCIGAPVRRHRPGLRRARDRAPVRRHRDQALVAVAQDRHRRFHARELRIDGIGLAAVAAAQRAAARPGRPRRRRANANSRGHEERARRRPRRFMRRARASSGARAGWRGSRP